MSKSSRSASRMFETFFWRQGHIMSGEHSRQHPSFDVPVVVSIWTVHKTATCQKTRIDELLIGVLIALNEQNRRRCHFKSERSPFSNEQLIEAACLSFLFQITVSELIDSSNLFLTRLILKMAESPF